MGICSFWLCRHLQVVTEPVGRSVKLHTNTEKQPLQTQTHRVRVHQALPKLSKIVQIIFWMAVKFSGWLSNGFLPIFGCLRGFGTVFGSHVAIGLTWIGSIG